MPSFNASSGCLVASRATWLSAGRATWRICTCTRSHSHISLPQNNRLIYSGTPCVRFQFSFLRPSLFNVNTKTSISQKEVPAGSFKP